MSSIKMYEELKLPAGEEELRIVDNGNYNITENRRYEMWVHYKSGKHGVGGTEIVDRCEIHWGWNKHIKPEGTYVDTQNWEIYRVIHLSHYTPR